MMSKWVGDYRLVAVLGKGQFGVVHRAIRAQEPYKSYAVKCIPKSSIQVNSYVESLFKTEVSIMSSIVCPQIMKLYELIETNNNFYLVLQFCNGGDLEKALAKVGRFPEHRAIEYLYQLRLAFEQLQKLKVMHRDVKLANIFLNNDEVILGDFGFAKQGVEMTQTKLGTPITMAPEMLSPGGSYTSKADLWSLGIVFYQMLYGKIPFDVLNFDELKVKVLTQSGSRLNFPQHVSVSEESKNLLRNILQADPSKRMEWSQFFSSPIFRNTYAQSKFNSMEVKFPSHSPSRAAVHTPAILTNYFSEKRSSPSYVKASLDFALNKSESVDLSHISRFFEHRRRTIVFVMFAVRKIRNVSKARSQVGNEGDLLMLCASLLMIKGLQMLEETLKCFKFSINVFGLDDFEHFAGTSEFSQTEKYFLEDKAVYDLFAQQIRKRFDEEVKDLSIISRLNRLKSEKQDSKELNTAIHEAFLETKSLSRKQFPTAFREELWIALLLLHFAGNSERVFQADPSRNFDWKEFEQTLNPQTALILFPSIY